MRKVALFAALLTLLGCGNSDDALVTTATPELSPGEEMDLAALPYADWRPLNLGAAAGPGNNWISLGWEDYVPRPEFYGWTRYTIQMKPGIDPSDHGWVTVVDHEVWWATVFDVVWGLEPDTWYMFRMTMTIYDENQRSNFLPPLGNVVGELNALHPRIYRAKTRDYGALLSPDEWAQTDEGAELLSRPGAKIIDVSELLNRKYEGVVE